MNWKGKNKIQCGGDQKLHGNNTQHLCYYYFAHYTPRGEVKLHKTLIVERFFLPRSIMHTLTLISPMIIVRKKSQHFFSSSKKLNNFFIAAKPHIIEQSQ